MAYNYNYAASAVSVPTTSSGLTFAPAGDCTLIYKLNDDAPVTFKQFSLVVRSLHQFRVEKIEPKEEDKTVIVKLQYNASMKNVRAKLGGFPATVNKQNPFIELSELGELETLRSTFNFGELAEEEEVEAPRPVKKRKYAKVSKSHVQVPSTQHQ